MKGILLIIEDTLDTVRVLRKILREEGFKVLIAQDGQQGIERAEYTLPDLILLDVMMPGMNGFEVCQHLKAGEKTRDIPIIFMTALSDTHDKIKGLTLGAVDYITKPIQHEEVLVRVMTQVKLRKQQQQLQTELKIRREYAIELERRNMELNTFARTVAHDLKNPLNGIIGLSECLLFDYQEGNLFDTKARQYIGHIAEVGHKMTDIIDALLLLAGVSKQGVVEMEELNMSTIVNQVLEKRLVYMVTDFQAHIALPTTWPTVRGYAPWVEEIWANYISNGLKYGGVPPRLELGAQPENGNMVRFWVRDNGRGLSTEECAKLFIPFSRLKKSLHTEGHGLGLSIVQQIVERLGGQVGVESCEQQGSLFYFTLPIS